MTAALQRLNRTHARLMRRVAARGALLNRLSLYRKTIAATRKRPAGPARDFKLRRLLAEARALAERVSRLDREIHTLTEALAKDRAALAGRLNTLPGPERRRAQRALAKTQSARRPPRLLRVARPRIHPLDGPQEIDEKADLLHDSAEKVRRRLAEIDAVIARLRQRQRLRQISRRVDRYTGLFAEDATRRRVTRIRPDRTTPPAAGPETAGAPPQGADGLQGGAYNGSGGTSGELDAQTEPARLTTPGTYAVVLREVLTPATVDALRRADARGDPAARLRALMRARQELARTAARLRARARAYHRKAQSLRRQQRRGRR